MNGWNAHRLRRTCRRYGASKAGRRAGLAVLAFSLTAGLAIPAQAQFLRSWWWHSDEGPPPIPPANVGGRALSWRPEAAYETVSLEELHRRASRLGLRLVAKPHRRGHVFIAFAEDAHGVLHHLVFDAHAGTLIENAPTSVITKAKASEAPHEATKKPLTSASVAPAAAVPTPVHPTVSAATPAAKPPAKEIAKVKPKPASSEKAAVASSTLADRDDLSPIKPQPAWMAGPTPQDPNIDKD